MSPNQPPEALNQNSATEMLISARSPMSTAEIFQNYFPVKIQPYLNFSGSSLQLIVIFLAHKELADK